jgi:hypothetical protein
MTTSPATVALGRPDAILVAESASVARTVVGSAVAANFTGRLLGSTSRPLTHPPGATWSSRWSHQLTSTPTVPDGQPRRGWGGMFANIRLRNQLMPGIEGGFTQHLPGGQQRSTVGRRRRLTRVRSTAATCGNRSEPCGVGQAEVPHHRTGLRTVRALPATGKGLRPPHRPVPCRSDVRKGIVGGTGVCRAEGPRAINVG